RRGRGSAVSKTTRTKSFFEAESWSRYRYAPLTSRSCDDDEPDVAAPAAGASAAVATTPARRAETVRFIQGPFGACGMDGPSVPARPALRNPGGIPPRRSRPPRGRYGELHPVAAATGRS